MLRYLSYTEQSAITDSYKLVEYHCYPAMVHLLSSSQLEGFPYPVWWSTEHTSGHLQGTKGPLPR